ncbi:hypothetical protein D3C71_1111280 [compost metagenome]
MQGFFRAVKQAGLEEVERQRVLGAFAVGAGEVAAREQVLVHAHGAVVFAPAAEQIAEGKVQFRRIGIVLHGLDESVDGLVLLLVEQEVQAFEIGLGRAAVFCTQLAQVKTRSQPTQHKGHGQTQQDPGQVKFHGLKAGRAVVAGRGAWSPLLRRMPRA